ncbi:unnamed protein product [Pieris macdunnoughi]|uniref:DDE-1 domain-containing protein n=1 Tax=Pieris macdunnoughi TaxID=345717 RepID=A0A821XT83_9NEOP|nr:unnamed protein product [Pieris macdunnoughi]
MEVLVTKATANKARKRTRNPENWKANIAKKQRYMPKKAPERIICSHKNKHLKCSSLTMTDIMNFHSSFYSSNKRSDQDALILKCCKTQKVFSSYAQIEQSNEKENLTVLLTFNANGDMCPPCIVFPYIRPPKAVVNSMPQNWCLGRSETGWMREVFFEYITNEFNNWILENNIKKPVLLLVDGHKSHMSLMLSTACEQLQIILYPLPPNTTHILQPADTYKNAQCVVSSGMEAHCKNVAEVMFAIEQMYRESLFP